MNPISAKDCSLIEADILLANTAMANKENLHMVAMAAYHYSQAIEKSLKAIIKANDEKNPDYTHDIATLLVRTELCCPNFIADHKFIADNSAELSAMNGLRYGDKAIRKGDAYVLMKEAQRLYEELEQDLMKTVSMDKTQLQKQANTMYKDNGTFLSLDDKNSNYKSHSKKGLLSRE